MSDKPATILVVDDDMLNRVLLSTNLQDAGYGVEVAQDGEQALQLLEDNLYHYDAVLLDLIMPGIDGFEVLKRIKNNDTMRHLPVIIISAADEMESIVRCIEMGATDNLSKPFNPTLLHARIKASLAEKRLIEQEEQHSREIKEYNQRLEGRVAEQTQEIRKAAESLRQTLHDTVLVLSSVGEVRDPYTAGHQKRVAALSCAIGQQLHLDEQRIEGIRVCGTLHDIGKVCVPSEILSKPGKITDIEFALIKNHAQVGHDILKTIAFPWPVAEIVLQHHERMNGSGYPKGLKGDDIHLEARIIGVADVVEAMAYHRPYRPALGAEIALQELMDKKGSHYDPQIVDICLGLFANNNFSFEAVEARI